MKKLFVLLTLVLGCGGSQVSSTEEAMSGAAGTCIECAMDAADSKNEGPETTDAQAEGGNGTGGNSSGGSSGTAGSAGTGGTHVGGSGQGGSSSNGGTSTGGAAGGSTGGTSQGGAGAGGGCSGTACGPDGSVCCVDGATCAAPGTTCDCSEGTWHCKGGTGGSGGVGGSTGGAGGTGGSNGGSAGTGGVGGSVGGAGGTGGAGGSSPCGPLEELRGSFCVAKSVPITGGYSIDATEVTRAQYAAWLATNPDVSYSEHCVGKTTHVPPDWCMQSDYVCQNNCGKHPQVCVDWCDANDYCQAMGKKLCSAIPGEAPYMQGYRNMNNKSEWYRACTSNALQGTHLYPYGDTYDPQACNGHDNAITGGGTGHGTTVEVGSLSGCQGTGAYAGIYDLVGNVQELEDYAHTTVYPYTPKAGLRGGSFWNSYLPNFPSSEINRCDANVADENPFPDSGTGFRCCSE